MTDDDYEHPTVLKITIEARQGGDPKALLNALSGVQEACYDNIVTLDEDVTIMLRVQEPS